MEASTRESSQTPKLYKNSGAKNSIMWKYFGFIKAKMDLQLKPRYDKGYNIILCRKSYANQGKHPFNN